MGGVVSKAKQAIGMETPPASEVEGPVRTVREAWQAFGQGEWEGFTGKLTENVRWVAPKSGNFPGGGELEGREAIRKEFVGDIDRTYASFGFLPESFVEAPDDEIIVFGRFECEGRSGGNVDEGAVQLWKFDGDCAEEVRIYTDSAAFPDVLSEEDESELESKIEAEESESSEGEREGRFDRDEESESEESEEKAEAKL